MKILQISSANTFGGGEKHLVDLSKALMGKGHDVFAVVRPTSEWKKNLVFLPEKNIFRVSLRNSLDIFSARKLAKIIRENDVEIVHAHLARDYPAAGLAVRLAPPAKLVLTRHVLFPMNPLQKLVLNNVSKAIAVSSAVKSELEKVFPSEKIAKIPNGIETEHFSGAKGEELKRAFRFENNIPFDAPFIGIIGELKLLKGQEDFVLAAQVIAGKFPDAHFAVIGKDNSFKQDFRRELKRLVKVFGLENHFLWLDWVEDTAMILHALDVFVSASHSESFGLAILEAMASATAIVAAETEGAKELLQNDFSAKLVSVKNPVQIAEAVCELLSDENLRKNLGKNAQKIALEKFGLKQMIEETEKVYREVL